RDFHVTGVQTCALPIFGRLKEYGLQFNVSEDALQHQTELLKGQTFVVSGVFEKVSRDELKKLIEDNGGKVGSSISSKTSYLVARSEERRVGKVIGSSER